MTEKVPCKTGSEVKKRAWITYFEDIWPELTFLLSNVVEHLVHGDPKSELRCATTYLLAVDARNKAAQSVSPLITGAQRTCKDDVEEGVQRTWLMLNPVNDESYNFV